MNQTQTEIGEQRRLPDWMFWGAMLLILAAGVTWEVTRKRSTASADGQATQATTPAKKEPVITPIEMHTSNLMERVMRLDDQIYWLPQVTKDETFVGGHSDRYVVATNEVWFRVHGELADITLLAAPVVAEWLSASRKDVPVEEQIGLRQLVARQYQELVANPPTEEKHLNNPGYFVTINDHVVEVLPLSTGHWVLSVIPRQMYQSSASAEVWSTERMLQYREEMRGRMRERQR